MSAEQRGPIAALIRFCLENKLIVLVAMTGLVLWGLMSAPFDWELGPIERDPVPVDAIPDTGENQQIVFTEWMGRSPQDVEDQITYPLTTALLGLPHVKDVRSTSMFGFSTINVIFEDGVDFYWSRSRVLEKLNSLPQGALPDGVQPQLGPDATALGQVFWYTLEGRDPDGNPAGGWDLHELRSVQDWNVRFKLMSAAGVSEVASVGGFVKEYQVDVDPDAMRAHGVTLDQVFNAVRMSNVDVGARTIEVNRVEYVIRGLGFVQNVEDLEQTVVKATDNVPIFIENVAHVSLGPALRRGALDKAGAEAVGGVVVVRYGYNPLQAIENVKKVIARIAPGLPKKAFIDWDQVDRAAVEAFARERGFVAFKDGAIYQDAWLHWLEQTQQQRKQQWPEWVTISQLQIVPFYDRTGLIHETLQTLKTALTDEAMVTIIVVILMLLHLRSSLLISGMLPLAVLMTFIAMKVFHVDANIVALSGIAIAIGTIVDMGIVMTENMLKHLDEADPEDNRLEIIFRAATEVGGAVLTAVATTVVSFLPVFALQAAEGKLFRPLAFTKTFALIASILITLTFIPPMAHLLFTRIGGRGQSRRRRLMQVLFSLLIVAGLALSIFVSVVVGLAVALLGLWRLVDDLLPDSYRNPVRQTVNYLLAFLVGLVLASHWQPLGPEHGLGNVVFVVALIGGVMLFFAGVMKAYEPVLRWSLRYKYLFLPIPLGIVVSGVLVWQGMGREFMPPLDEGSYLLMPTTGAHASIGEAMDVMRKQDLAIRRIPEVKDVVGKIGRVDSALDPAPVNMVETVITYRSEYKTDARGNILLFRTDETGAFVQDADGNLIEDPSGQPLRQWREGVRSPEDIWKEIQNAATLPGTTGASRLQPIEARRVMLQTGLRAPIGMKIFAPDLETLEDMTTRLEQVLKQVPAVDSSTVVADRVVGKPYLEIRPRREDIARFGLHMRDVQDVIEVAVGGRKVTTSVEGRERYPIRVRYLRERRDSIESFGAILVAGRDGAQVPLRQVADIRFVRGPQAIKSEDTQLVGYVTFDKRADAAQVETVEAVQDHLKRLQAEGDLLVPAGVHWKFAGEYENQQRAQRRLAWVIPLALALIFLLLYLQFRQVSTAIWIFSGVFVAAAGGFLMLWLYAQPEFLNITVFGTNLRELFNVRAFNLSVAVWVGFLALWGIATDDGVIMATYIRQRLEADRPQTVQGIREAVVAAGKRRIRPCLMTSATTILALVPVLMSTGRGADIMVPMAIPSFGGMTIVLITIFVVPTLYSWWEETKLWLGHVFGNAAPEESDQDAQTQTEDNTAVRSQ